jgi:hypothetical protein
MWLMAPLELNGPQAMQINGVCQSAHLSSYLPNMQRGQAMEKNEKITLTVEQVHACVEASLGQHVEVLGDVETLIDLHCEGWFISQKTILRDDIRALIRALVPVVMERITKVYQAIKVD